MVCICSIGTMPNCALEPRTVLAKLEYDGGETEHVLKIRFPIVFVGENPRNMLISKSIVK